MMSIRTVAPICLLFSYALLLGAQEWSFTCPKFCSCMVSDSMGQQSYVESQLVTVTDSSLSFAPFDLSLYCEVKNETFLSLFFASIPTENVTKFTLRHSDLWTTSEVPRMGKLQVLDLSQNHLENVLAYDTMAYFGSVTTLNMSHNNITMLRQEEFAQFRRLKVLDLRFNQIHTIAQGTFRVDLVEILLGHNNIRQLHYMTFRLITRTLERLDLSFNQLTAIEESNLMLFMGLKHLNLAGNALTGLRNAFSGMTSLAELDLSHNRFTRFPNADLRQAVLPSLHSVWFDGNPIQILDSGFIIDLNISFLSLSHTKQLEFIQAGAITSLHKLTQLKISENRKLTFISSHAFQALPKLKNISLEKNKLSRLPTVLFERLQSLQNVDIDGNDLSCECFEPSRKTWRLYFDEDVKCVSNKNGVRYSLLKGDRKYPGECTPTIFPQYDRAMVTAKLGFSTRLFCALSYSTDDTSRSHNLKSSLHWILPSGQQLGLGNTTNDGVSEFTVDEEGLSIDYVLQNHSGQYICRLNEPNTHMTRVTRTHTVTLGVQSPHTSLVSFGVDGDYATFKINQSSELFPLDSFKVFFAQLYENTTASPETFDVVDQKPYYFLARNYQLVSVYRLRPLTNYSVCLRYIRKEHILYESCTEIRTPENRDMRFGISINYSLIAVLCTLLSLVFSICLARCVHQRYYIWQREKHRSQMAASISGRGFFASNDSIRTNASQEHSIAGVVYDNSHCVDFSNPTSVRSEAEHSSLLHDVKLELQNYSADEHPRLHQNNLNKTENGTEMQTMRCEPARPDNFFEDAGFIVNTASNGRPRTIIRDMEI